LTVMQITLGVLFITPVSMFSQEQTSGHHDRVPTSSVGSAPSPSAIPPAWLPPLTAGEKVGRRTLGLVGPLTLFGSSFSAGLGQLRDKPPEWGQGSAGFARRFANAEGFAATHNMIALGFDLGFHLDPRYRRIPQGKFGSRLRNAVAQTFLAYNDSGHRRINVSEIAGDIGAGLIANTWEPPQSNSFGKGLTRGILALGYHTLRNIAAEFLPDLLHRGR
jgi:hypothetical protein